MYVLWQSDVFYGIQGFLKNMILGKQLGTFNRHFLKEKSPHLNKYVEEQFDAYTELY